MSKRVRRKRRSTRIRFLWWLKARCRALRQRLEAWSEAVCDAALRCWYRAKPVLARWRRNGLLAASFIILLVDQLSDTIETFMTKEWAQITTADVILSVVAVLAAVWGVAKEFREADSGSLNDDACDLSDGLSQILRADVHVAVFVLEGRYFREVGRSSPRFHQQVWKLGQEPIGTANDTPSEFPLWRLRQIQDFDTYAEYRRSAGDEEMALTADQWYALQGLRTCLRYPLKNQRGAVVGLIVAFSEDLVEGAPMKDQYDLLRFLNFQTRRIVRTLK